MMESEMSVDDTTIQLRVGGIDTGPVPLDMMRRALDDLRGAAPMREIAAAELRAFVERFERLEAEKKDIADAQKEVMAEAKARGYLPKILRRIIALRKRDKDDIAEEEALLALYKAALGMD
jgi:uncharacterized protein (UPF0335 family)